MWRSVLPTGVRAMSVEATKLARTLIELADQVERDETLLKGKILAAIESGDVVGARDMLRRWGIDPAAEVLRRSPPGRGGAR